MSFLYPLGLLGLIGIPILILIYIIKNKYTEQTVSSTYLWELSERFIKRRRRRHPLEGLLPLILQILTVFFISLAIAHPIIRLPGTAREYTFILDSSGSMSIEIDGESRFERGKQEIEALIADAPAGSTFTLIQVGSTTSLVFEQITDTELAVSMLAELTPSHHANDEAGALRLAQTYFNENAGAKTYFVTDTAVDEHYNVTVINTALDEVNYALSGVTHMFGVGGLSVQGEVSLYGADTATVTLALSLDGGAPITQTLALHKDAATPFDFTVEAEYFEALRVEITEPDALALDNVHVIYDLKSTAIYDTLIVSDRPLFIEMAVKNLGYRNVAVLTPAQYRGQNGFGLYIFDTCTPDPVPTDGTVWHINPDGKVDNTGFGVRDVITLESGEEILMSDSTQTLTKTLLQGVEGNEIYVKTYVECALYRNFSTLFSYNEVPLLFVGNTQSGNREVVFAFDLHDSNLPMTVDYVVLMSNLLQYSFPDIVERVNYTVGEEASINVPAGTKSIKAVSPTGDELYLSTASPVANLPLTEVGTWELTLDAQSTIRLYASLPQEESEVKPTALTLSLQGEASDEGLDGEYDPMTVILILLVLVFFADWMVYCHEKYQLR